MNIRRIAGISIVAAMEKWQRLLSDFQDASDRFVSSLNQTYAERADQIAAGAVAA